MKEYDIKFSTEKTDKDFIDGKILEGVNAAGCKPFEEFGFYIKEGDKIIAGVAGAILFGSAYIDSLWTDKNSRRQGIGSKLVHKVEEYAISKGYKFVTMNTLEFQALPFYQKLGYEIEYERKNCENGYSLYSLIKEL